MKKNMNKKTLSICSAFLVAALVGIVGMASNAENLTFKSTGDVKTKDGTTLFSVSDLTALDQKINAVKTELTTLENNVGNSKDVILDILEENPNLEVDPDASFEDIPGYILQMTMVPENTYFYEEGTEGNASTIKRYKKIGSDYFACDEHGKVAENAPVEDVSSKTLIAYTATTAENMSAGAAGYASNSFFLGNGADNNASYAQGFIDGQLNATENLKIEYTYHVHEGNNTVVGGCYKKLTGKTPVKCGCNSYDHTDEGGVSNCANCGHNHGSKKCDAVISYKDYSYIGLGCKMTEKTIVSATIIY